MQLETSPYGGLHRQYSAGLRRRRRTRRRDKPFLQCEVLEVRLVPSTFTWTGGGANTNWSTGANWQGGVSPTGGSTLVFGTGESRLTNVNDIVGLSIAEITLAGGYSISGNAITLTGSGGVGIDSQSGTNAFNNAIALGASLNFTEDAGQLTLGGVLSGAQSLTKGGPGTLVASGANTYTGTTTVSAGTLDIAADNNLGTAPAVATAGSLTINGGTLATTATFTLSANRGLSLGASGATIDVASGTTLTYKGIAAGTGSLIKIDSGTLALGGANTYSGGTTVSAGTLADGVTNALPTGGSLTISGTGTFDLAGFAQTVAGLADGGVGTGILTDSGAAATFTANIAASSSFSGTITNGIHALALTKTGTGTLILAARTPTPASRR